MRWRVSDGARVACEEREQIELLGCEHQLAAGEVRAPRARVDLEPADLRGRCRLPGARARPARDGPDAREQLTEAERLDEEVVCPELEPDDAVDLLAASRDDDDRDLGARAQLPADRVAVHVRQAQIEQHDVDLGIAAGGQRLSAGRRARDGVALAHEAFGQRLGDRVLVLDNQHAHGPHPDRCAAALPLFWRNPYVSRQAARPRATRPSCGGHAPTVATARRGRIGEGPQRWRGLPESWRNLDGRRTRA